MRGPPHLLPRGRQWTLPLLVVALLAGHGVILYYGLSHLMLSAGVVSALVILVAIWHTRRANKL